MTPRTSIALPHAARVPSLRARVAATAGAAALGALMLWSALLCIAWGCEVQIRGRSAYDYSLWPWNRAWFMFSWNDGLGHRLEVIGHRENGADVAIDTGRWLKYPVAFDSDRSSAVPWSYPALSAFGRYIAARHNETAPAAERAVRVSVQDVWWPNTPGRRRRHAEVSRLEKTQRKVVERIECQPLATPASPP